MLKSFLDLDRIAKFKKVIPMKIKQITDETLLKKATEGPHPLEVTPFSHIHDVISNEVLNWVKSKIDSEPDPKAAVVKVLEGAPGEDLLDGLYGPAVGDPPVSEAEVFYAPRGSRKYNSRLVHKPLRHTNKVVVVYGPGKEHPKVVYTIYGGSIAAPQEPGDPRVKNLEASEKFWSQHALSEEAI